VHRMPQIGEVAPGFWLLSGFGGHGLNTTAMGGELIARAIADGDLTWRQFLPFELVWAGGLLGRAALQTYYWGYRSRERIKGRMARDRRRKAEIAAQRAARDTPQVAAPGG
jgi:gamma-glutamylputrescine oxidase